MAHSGKITQWHNPPHIIITANYGELYQDEGVQKTPVQVEIVITDRAIAEQIVQGTIPIIGDDALKQLIIEAALLRLEG